MQNFEERYKKINVVTGATGFLGRALIKKILENKEVVYAVVGKNDLYSSQQRADMIFPGLIKKYNNKFKIIEGDVSRESLDFNKETIEELGDKIIYFWHLAANLSFREEEKEEIYKDNVDGAKNVVNFVNGLKEKSKLFYVSTAYVCGNKECCDEIVIKKDDHEKKLRNYYEKSKFIAERIIMENCNKEYAIFRPSIIIGEAYEGKAKGCTFGYYRFSYMFFVFKKWLLKSLNNRKFLFVTLARLLKIRYNKQKDSLALPFLFIPYPAKCNINVVPVDFVVDSIAHVSNDINSGKNKVYHLTNPNPPSFIFLFKILLDDLGLKGIKLVPVSPFVFRFIVRFLYFFIIPFRKYLNSAIKYFPYITRNYHFNNQNIAEYNLPFPRIAEDYMRKINKYAIEEVFDNIKCD